MSQRLVGQEVEREDGQDPAVGRSAEGIQSIAVRRVTNSTIKWVGYDNGFTRTPLALLSPP
eukprot:SAG31_NODE_1659_length_7602_cov_7.696122_3_plen_61_part_00